MQLLQIKKSLDAKYPLTKDVVCLSVPYIGFVAVLALALVLRLYRLDSISSDVDEYYERILLRPGDIAERLRVLFFWCPDNIPLAFCVQLIWAKIFGYSVTVLRLLPVLCGVIAVGLTYGLGWKVFHRCSVSFFAALLAALSPTHIWIAQSLRPNALMEMTALLSMLACLHALQTRKKHWWAVLFSINLFFAWLQPMMCMLLGVEFCFIVFVLWRDNPHKALRLAGCQFLIMLSPLLWIIPVAGNVLTAEDDFFMRFPTLTTILLDFFGDDAALSAEPFLFQGAGWAFLSKQARFFLLQNHLCFDWLLTGVYILVFVAASGVVLHRFTTQRKKKGGESNTIQILFLLAIVIMPLSALLFLSAIWRPLIQTRYTGYSSFALYILAAWLVMCIPWHRIRWVAILSLLLLYAYQLSVTLPGAARTDWKSAYTHIQSNAAPNDILLVKGTFLAWHVWRTNFPESEWTHCPAYTMQSMAEKSEAALRRTNDPPKNVWGIVAPFVFTLPPLSIFEGDLKARGLAFEKQFFPAMNGVYLYRVHLDSNAVIKPENPPIYPNTKCDLHQILTDFGIFPEDKVKYDAAHAALERTIDSEWPRTKFFYTLLSILLNNEGYIKLSARAAKVALSIDSDYAFANFALMLACAEQGDWNAAKTLFERIKGQDKRGYFRQYIELLTMIYEKQDISSARREFARLDQKGYYLPHLLWRRLGIATEMGCRMQ